MIIFNGITQLDGVTYSWIPPHFHCFIFAGPHNSPHLMTVFTRRSPTELCKSMIQKFSEHLITFTSTTWQQRHWGNRDESRQFRIFPQHSLLHLRLKQDSLTLRSTSDMTQELLLHLTTALTMMISTLLTTQPLTDCRVVHRLYPTDGHNNLHHYYTTLICRPKYTFMHRQHSSYCRLPKPGCRLQSTTFFLGYFKFFTVVRLRNWTWSTLIPHYNTLAGRSWWFWWSCRSRLVVAVLLLLVVVVMG